MMEMRVCRMIKIEENWSAALRASCSHLLVDQSLGQLINWDNCIGLFSCIRFLIKSADFEMLGYLQKFFFLKLLTKVGKTSSNDEVYDSTL